MKDAWDRIITSRPVNTDAGRAISGGTNFVSRKEVDKNQWLAPPPMKAIPSDTPDLRGKKFGRMTVIGMLAEKRSGGAAWVVRCVCGIYETRKARVICRPAIEGQEEEACFQCRRVIYLRDGMPLTERGRK